MSPPAGQQAQHSRQSSTLSINSVGMSTSASASPSASPVSPISGSLEGLSRRHSRNRREETTGIQEHHNGEASTGLGLRHLGGEDASVADLEQDGGWDLQGSRNGEAYAGRPEFQLHDGGSRSQLVQPSGEHDLGVRSSSKGHGQPISPADAHYPSYYFGANNLHQDQRDHPRPYFHRFDSEQSIEGSSSGHETLTEDDTDYQRLTIAPEASGSSHRRSPSKVYQVRGHARVPSVGAKVAGALNRNNTLRTVSKTIRKASVRVANVMGHENDGRVRLGDGEEEDEDLDSKAEGMDVVLPEVKDGIRPAPKPPEGGLRGRTLCVFGMNSRTRRAMNALLRNPLTEPTILLLIIANAVILTIQASKPLYQPRVDNGYFQAWEDYALFGLFIIFTFEMFARMIVSGFICDPETTLHDVLFGHDGFFPVLSRHFRRDPTSLRRNTSQITPTKASWRSFEAPAKSLPKPNSMLTVEAPFQKALEKQLSLSTQGRPYLRHSWHRVDMIAIIAFWITFVLAITKQEATPSRHLYIFRALSVLRAGRLLVITSGTTTILHSLKRAIPMLITVGFFLIFAFAIFSIIGVQSFRGSYRRQCALTDPWNTSNIIVNSQQNCGGYLSAELLNAPFLEENGRPALVGPKGYICPVNQVCQTETTNPNGGSTSFDNVLLSLVQVVIITVINGWSNLMYAAMDSDFFSSCLYFIVAVVILNFWFLNLLTAVVVHTFQDIRAETRRSAFGAADAIVGGAQPVVPTSATKTRKPKDGLLAFYEKTQLFWVALILADVVAQACRTSHSSAQLLSILKDLGLAFTLAFDLEIAIRILAYIPDWKGFLRRPRNVFDLFLAVSTSIVQIPAISSSSVYPWLTVFSLLRWYRVILAFPRMKPLLATVFGSFAGLINMIVFLFLINLIGALASVQLFRGDLSTDGNTISMYQTYNAFIGMYQVFSSENWTNLLDLAMQSEIPFQSQWLAAAFFCAWILFAYAIVLQMFIAVINENFAVAEEQKRQRQIEDFIRRSEPTAGRVTWIDRLNPYRYFDAQRGAVKVEALPPNLVLPLKQANAPDVGLGAAGYEKEDQMKGAKEAINRLFGRNDTKEHIPLRNLGRPRSARIEDLIDEEDDERGLSDLLPPLNAGPSADEHLDALRESRNQQADFIAAHPTYDRSLWFIKQSNPVRRFCQSCVSPGYGERIYGRPANPSLELALKAIMFFTIVASVVAGAIATPEYRKSYYDAHGVTRKTWFDLVEITLGLVFVVEAGIKIIADGFILSPNAYLLSLWNVLDFLILITLLVNTTTSLIYIGGLSRVTRALKAFRALRLITLFGRLRDTLHTVLFAGALKLLDASILMMLYLIPFAVWGVNIFAGLLYSCNDSSSSGIGDCVNEYLAGSVDDSLPYLVPRVWANPTLDQSVWAFDSFRESLLILFEIVSLEGWVNVMETGMSIVGLGQQSQTNASQWNAIYFILFNLLGAVVILTLFLSIIIGNFSRRSGDALLTQEQRRWVDLHKYIKAQTPSQLPKFRPQFGLRAWCYDRATQKHGYWAQTFTVIYYIHMLFLMFEDFSDNIFSDAQMDWIFLFLTILYACDLLIRFYGLGFKSFQANGWNIFDLIVITGSFATTIPALQAAAKGLPGSEVNTQLQKLFLVAIPFKLVQRMNSLNQLFKTSVASLPAIGNLFLLWATLFIFFSILMIEVFGLTKMGPDAYTRYQNFYSFGNALVMLSFMSTGEGWNGYMHDFTISSPRCTSDGNYLNSDCGSAAGAYALFISWNIISMYIFCNMFTGVVVESFAYVYQMPGQARLNREEMRAFKQLWAEFDTERTGYIRRKDFVRFFSRLSGIFEVRLYPEQFSIPVLLRSSIPDPVAKASGRVLVAQGVNWAVDLRRVQAQIKQIDYRQVRQRRQLFARLFHEARISEEKGRGISFTSMLMMLAHYKLIDDEQALLLDDLLVRREKTDRVTDLVNLDRVRGLLKTIYWRRRFLAYRDERRRTLNAEAMGIPAIVLDPTPSSPPDGRDPFEEEIISDDGHNSYGHGSRSSSRERSPSLSPETRHAQLSDSRGSQGVGIGHRPSLSVGSQPRPSLQRSVSDGSMLSSEDAHYRRDSPIEETPPEGYIESLSTSVWGDMMREAVDEQDE